MTSLALVRKSPHVLDGSASGDLDLKADVCVVGTGAGGAVTAAVLAEAGLDVVMVEEGGYYTSHDFTMREKDVMPRLYQGGGMLATKDGAVNILQGRAVGGTTVVNWTTAFRTPEDVVAHWHDRHDVKGFAYADLLPHYEAIEKRLAIAKVPEEEMNANNRKLFDGAKKLGWAADTLRRNVHACMQTGFCGLGCPVNAKRSMLVTMVPDAIDAGARLVFRARADRYETAGNSVRKLHASFFDAEGVTPTGKKLTVTAKRFVASGGAINTPALLLRSGIDDGDLVGRRTCIHPTIAVVGVYDEDVMPFHGAPQSAASHHFAHRGGEVGVFLEASAWYPAMLAAGAPDFGREHLAFMKQSDKTAVHVALAIDGFHDDVPGGRVTLRASGAPVLEYPIPPRLWSALRFAHERLADVQLASGAREVRSLHDPAVVVRSPGDVERAFDAAPFEIARVPVFTAHLMGGCGMGDDPKTSVVRSEDLRHHRLENLHVIDGSVFPTSLGVNPQESIYGLARLMATRVAARR